VGTALERVFSLFPQPGPDGVDLKAVVEDEQYWENADSILRPDAEIRFLTPDGGFVGGMAGPFRGPEGFRAGWREWLRPWETFAATIDAARESEDGSRVLLLVTSHGTMVGSGTKVDQPSAAVYEFDGERIGAIDHYLDHDQARRAFEEGAGKGT
jgi:ketosteroid isomerase-like protein